MNLNKAVYILAIESSCDETSAAILKDGKALSNVIATQKIHEQYGGVVPELASRAHLQNIVPVVDAAIKQSGIQKSELQAVGFTRAPGLVGSLLVGVGFAKSFAQALKIPLIAVDHMQAHVLAHWLDEPVPQFPFLCLTVSGGHTQLVLCQSHLEMQIIGQTIDDAAGEAFDKIAKMLDLPYPGGPLIDKYAQQGNPKAFEFPISNMPEYQFSFSGLKTAVLYFLQKKKKENSDFIAANIADICASVQYTIIKTLMRKLKKASKDLGVQHIGIAGGVSANSGLRNAVLKLGEENGWKTYIPKFEYCTDNAAMIAIVAYYKYLQQQFSDLYVAASARSEWSK